MNTDYETIEYIKKTITDLLQSGGFNVRVEYEQSLVSGLIFHIKSNQSKLLIGRQGMTLQALEHLVFAIVNRHQKDSSEPVRFSLDVDEYRSHRQWQLKQTVKDAVSKLKYSKEPVILPPMPRHERKFVHNYIQEQYPHLSTESIGEEPKRSIKMNI
ncbi:KH domain-containing protein [bacterium]|nr:MAG: KH domain-containing protein [bacterium]